MRPLLPATGQDVAAACVSQTQPPVVSERPRQAAGKRPELQEQSGLELVHTGDSQGPRSQLGTAGPAQGPAGPMPSLVLSRCCSAGVWAPTAPRSSSASVSARPSPLHTTHPLVNRLLPSTFLPPPPSWQGCQFSFVDRPHKPISPPVSFPIQLWLNLRCPAPAHLATNSACDWNSVPLCTGPAVFSTFPGLTP